MPALCEAPDSRRSVIGHNAYSEAEAKWRTDRAAFDGRPMSLVAVRVIIVVVVDRHVQAATNGHSSDGNDD